MGSTSFYAAAVTGAVLMFGAAAATAQSAAPSSEPSTLDRIEQAVKDTAHQAGAYIEWLIPYDLPQVQENGDILIRRDSPVATTDVTPPTETAPGNSSTGAIKL